MRAVTLSTNHPLHLALAECVRHKDLILTLDNEQETQEILLRDKNITIYGLWPVLQYLDERFPHPPYFPADPRKRALVRMATEEFNKRPVQELINIYEQAIPTTGFFAGEQPTILDLFLISLSSNSSEVWAEYKKRVHDRR